MSMTRRKHRIATTFLKNVSGLGPILNPAIRMRITENDQKKPARMANRSPWERIIGVVLDERICRSFLLQFFGESKLYSCPLDVSFRRNRRLSWDTLMTENY